MQDHPEDAVQRLIEREIGWDLAAWKALPPEEQMQLLVGLAKHMIPMISWYREHAWMLLREKYLRENHNAGG